MVGTTLTHIRTRLWEMADGTGEYYLVCHRSGARPVAANNLRFESREAARTAVRGVRQYRRALRRYYPRLPAADVVVCQTRPRLRPRAGPTGAADGARSEVGEPGAGPEPEPGGRAERPSLGGGLGEYCHRVAAVVFESLVDAGHGRVEAAILDTYADLATVHATPDDLCRRLLESMSVTLAERVDPAGQRAILSRAAARLGVPDDDGRPVERGLRRLRTRGVIEDGEVVRRSVDLDRETRSVVLGVSGYALRPRESGLPTLPLAVKLTGHRPAHEPVVAACTAAGGWRLRVTAGDDGAAGGLTSVPVRSTSEAR